MTIDFSLVPWQSEFDGPSTGFASQDGWGVNDGLDGRRYFSLEVYRRAENPLTETRYPPGEMPLMMITASIYPRSDTRAIMGLGNGSGN